MGYEWPLGVSHGEAAIVQTLLQRTGQFAKRRRRCGTTDPKQAVVLPDAETIQHQLKGNAMNFTGDTL